MAGKVVALETHPGRQAHTHSGRGSGAAAHSVVVPFIKGIAVALLGSLLLTGGILWALQERPGAPAQSDRPSLVLETGDGRALGRTGPLIGAAARTDFPDVLVNAVLSIEDRRFYRHVGVDPQGILRAARVNLGAGKIVEGGSTITQQLVKLRGAGHFFLSQAGEGLRCKIIANTGSFARLLAYFRIPIVVTLETPVDQKGSCPQEILKHLGDPSELFEKNFFDLTRERQIRDHLEHLKKTQILMAGCETDVCVLQSCLGLLSLDYEVYLMEELLFSSSPNVESAVSRMQSAGAVLVSYKTLYYELLGSVRGNGFSEEMEQQFGPLPGDLPDSAAG